MLLTQHAVSLVISPEVMDLLRGMERDLDQEHVGRILAGKRKRITIKEVLKLGKQERKNKEGKERECL